jgi:hypothetical protein
MVRGQSNNRKADGKVAMRTTKPLLATMAFAITMLVPAGVAMAHAPRADHRDGSWAQVDESHHGVFICDNDADRHRAYGLVWEADTPQPVRTGYDAKGHDVRGDYCLYYRSPFLPIYSFAICVRLEGCSEWTYVEGTIPEARRD